MGNPVTLSQLCIILFDGTNVGICGVERVRQRRPICNQSYAYLSNGNCHESDCSF